MQPAQASPHAEDEPPAHDGSVGIPELERSLAALQVSCAPSRGHATHSTVCRPSACICSARTGMSRSSAQCALTPLRRKRCDTKRNCAPPPSSSFFFLRPAAAARAPNSMELSEPPIKKRVAMQRPQSSCWSSSCPPSPPPAPLSRLQPLPSAAWQNHRLKQQMLPPRARTPRSRSTSRSRRR